MDISLFFYTYLGMYIVQAFCHSVIAFIIVERTIHILEITDPIVRQRFRIVTIIIAILSMPLYQLINPDRGSIFFRQNSLLDSIRWLNLEILWGIPIWLFFLIMIISTSLIFVFQELIPILRHALESRNSPEIKEKFDISSFNYSIEELGDIMPDIFLLDDEDYILYSTTGNNPAIYLSKGIISTLNMDQLKAVIAHEIAHIKRNRNFFLIIIFLFRILMFFNPVVLIGFRKIIQDEEKICDDMAVSLTKNPHALSDALKKLYLKKEEKPIKISEIGDFVEDYSHNIQIQSRIHRLEKERNYKTGGNLFEFIITITIILGINYFVV